MPGINSLWIRWVAFKSNRAIEREQRVTVFHPHSWRSIERKGRNSPSKDRSVRVMSNLPIICNSSVSRPTAENMRFTHFTRAENVGPLVDYANQVSERICRCAHHQSRSEGPH